MHVSDLRDHLDAYRYIPGALTNPSPAYTATLHTARDSVIAFLSAPLPSARNYTCAEYGCDRPAAMREISEFPLPGQGNRKGVGFYGRCRDHA